MRETVTSMILAATGHRPDKLGGYDEATFDRLTAFARRTLSDRGPAKVISGMALGWDQAVATAAVQLGIPFIAAVPFQGFAARWPQGSRYRLTALLCDAAEIHVVSEVPGARALQLRNEWMVDRADRMLALWNGSWGGTFNCIQYANRRKVPVENLWGDWSGNLTSILT